MPRIFIPFDYNIREKKYGYRTKKKIFNPSSISPWKGERFPLLLKEGPSGEN
jgi:hypothetical protein